MSDAADPQSVPRRAVALGYDRDRDAAPRVLASGHGDHAARIIAEAQEHGVPVESDPDLAAVLGQLELGDRIPEEAFQAVAALLAFLYRVNDETATGE